VAAELSSTGGTTWARTASTDVDVYLRTAVSVDPQGWAQFGHVKMPDYRWGIFLANPAKPTARSTFGDHMGETAWQDVPGEHRANAAPHHRHAGRHRAGLGRAAASPRPDRAQRSTTCATSSRSTSRKAATCGRWCTCCTSTSAATAARKREALLERRSGDDDNPRILGAFNEPTPDWLSFFMFTYFTDRDGKFQLLRAGRVGLRPAGAHHQASC
jgi:benzoyl-CoA 2,3-dioxygenase component B